jgi:hypothetical protein
LSINLISLKIKFKFQVESAAVNGEKVRKTWEKEKRKEKKKASLFKALVKANVPIMLWTMFLTTVWCGILIFVPIYLVRNLILFVQADEYSPSGWVSFLKL